MKIGAILQSVSVEIGMGCNLAELHPQCPVGLGLARYAKVNTSRKMTEADMIDLIRRFYADYDFRGWVNYSYYNEPFGQLPLLLRMAHATATVAPECPRMVVTNGTLLPEDVTPLQIFTSVHITNYGGAQTPDPVKVAALREITEVCLNRGRLDSRMSGPGPDRSHRGCLYPLADLTIDHFGNLRMCCFDWQGLSSPSNLFVHGLDDALVRWEATLKTIARTRMTEDTPSVCRTCQHTHFLTLTRRHLGARRMGKLWLKEQGA